MLAPEGEDKDAKPELAGAVQYPNPWSLAWDDVVAGCYQLEQAVEVNRAQRESTEKHVAWCRDRAAAGLAGYFALLVAGVNVAGPIYRFLDRHQGWIGPSLLFILLPILLAILLPWAAIAAGEQSQKLADGWNMDEVALRAALGNYRTRRAQLEREAK